jgi:hypothetical protein
MKYRETAAGHGKTTDAFERLSIDLDSDDDYEQDGNFADDEDPNSGSLYSKFDNIIGK